jgi:murein DD-endopeptidase MepM/ murein hydrolase activator NlpD
LQGATGQRIRNMYMGGRLSWLEQMLSTQDLNIVMDLLYYRKKVIAQDKLLLNGLHYKTQELNQEKVQLASRQSVLTQTIAGIQTSKQVITGQIRSEAALRQRYLNDAAYYEKLERQLLAESASITRLLRSLKVGKVVNSTGQFMWPVSGRITSGFGTRFHPIHRRTIMHTGLDISAPTGRSVSAADGGTVFFAGWRGGYGKAVILTHSSKGGQTIATLYGHLSSINVGQGQSVTKGQTIGRVGSTGHSTGPHLHFEVRVSGSPVNPLSYL